MNTLKNSVQLIGNLGNAPEIKNLESGKTLAKFTLATSESYKDKSGEKVENTQWHKLVAWGNMAKIAEQYLDKGSKVAVNGKLVYRSYEDKEGITKYITEIVVNEFLMMDKKK